MNHLSRTIFFVALVAPLSVIAQTSAPSSTGGAGTTPAAGYETKKTTDSGQSTTYPKGGTPASKPSGAVDKAQGEITKGDGKASSTSAKPLDEAAATDKPAKSGSQSGATPK